MRRRDFITLLGSGSLAWPFAARAQQAGKVFRIGLIGANLDIPKAAAEHQAFLAELRELG